MLRVIHTAQALVDLVIEVPDLPPCGGNVMAPAATAYAGGAVTVLLAAARSGAQAVHAGSIGTGPYGDLIRAALAADSVTVSSPAVPGQDTAVCVVMIEPSAERTFVTTRGAERVISAASLATSAPASGDFVCVSGYSLLEPTCTPLLSWLENLPDGVRIVLDPGAVFAELPGEVQARMLALTHVWTSNLEEAQALCGKETPGGAARQISELLPGGVVIVRDGPEGCWVRESATVQVPGFPQRAVDTNGAGDTHTGALLARRAEGWDWAASARWANAAGAIKVTRRGPTSVPTAQEIEGFLAVQTSQSFPLEF